MSIVERTLEKLREDSARAAAQRGTVAIGTVTATSGAATRDALPDTFVPPARQILVDRQALRAEGYLPEVTEDRAFADQYRQIKRPLVAAALASSARGPGSPGLIMVASALPGDGKTFTGINLALSLARERDTSVVLVDGDLAKPHTSRIFGAENEQGLFDALVDEHIDIESLVLPTDVRGLSILPTGRIRDGATELLASERMRQLLTRLQERNPRRLVLIDSSPLLVTSESAAMASLVGQVVLVVRSGKTPKQAVLDAISKLGTARHVSLVLNQGRPTISQSYYGQRYYGDEQVAQS